MIAMKQKAAALKAIAKANGGILTPDAVVEHARDPKSILHGDFDWNDQTAAHEQRLNAARRLITSIRVVIEIKNVKVSAISYVRDIRQERGDQGYISVEGLARRKEDAKETLLLELERIIGTVQRTRMIAASLGLESFFEAILEEALQAQMVIQGEK
jgi:hypothetical protein